MQLLQYLGHTSPECLESFDRKLNEPAVPPISTEIEQEAIASVINQRNIEMEESKLIQNSESMQGPPIFRPHSRNEETCISGGGGDSSLQQAGYSFKKETSIE